MQPTFSTKLWGYRKAEVDAYIKALLEENEKKLAALEAERQELGQTHSSHQAELDSLRKELNKYQQSEKALAEALVQAQIKAAAIEEEARRQAEDIEKSAMAEVKAKKIELGNLRLQYEKAQDEFKMLLDKYRSLLEERGKGPEARTGGDRPRELE